MKNILCFGDSNTWGYNPNTKDRYPWGIRWTSRLQDRLLGSDFNIIEQGLCGRTTVFEDVSRPNRNGADGLRRLLGRVDAIDYIVIMLGTNDCKSCYDNSEKEIALGVEKCIELALEHVSPDRVLLISPIHLGEKVWRQEYDPEFNEKSVLISRNLKSSYEKIAKDKRIHFLAASEYAKPSESDQEHLDANGHNRLAEAIFDVVENNWLCA